MSRLIIVSKSPASPPIRREHALATLAVEAGIEVVFVEPPTDIRDAIPSRGGWLRDLLHPRVRDGQWGTVASPAVVVPGHRSSLALATATHGISRVLRTVVRDGDVVCVMTPWDWPAVSRISGVRRVFDCADDWPALIPRRAHALRGLIRRAAADADEVIIASPKLAALFAPRAVTVVRNAAGSECLATLPVPRLQGERAIYVGTLSERVDISLIVAALVELPELQVDLVGPCAFAGLGAAPSQEMLGAVAKYPERLTWRGPVGREFVPGVIDAADVGLLPFHPHLARGDVMKVYDYAARARPMVSVAGVVDAGLGSVPGLFESDTDISFARAVEEAFAAPDDTLAPARRWAEANGWEARWPRWRDVLFGSST